jgi:dihydroorotase
VLEHITTREAAAVRRARRAGNVAATITAHHLLMNRNALFQGGIRPHHYCLPVLKREPHRRALMKVATSGSPKFFLGTDSAPHARNTKETDRAVAPACTPRTPRIELYAEVFDQAPAPWTASRASPATTAPDFYGLPRNTGKVTLARHRAACPNTVRPCRRSAMR